MVSHLWQRANNLGIKDISSRTSNTRVIRLIQKKEGHKSCYATEHNQECNQQCEWSEQCCGLRARWLG